MGADTHSHHGEAFPIDAAAAAAIDGFAPAMISAATMHGVDLIDLD